MTNQDRKPSHPGELRSEDLTAGVDIIVFDRADGVFGQYTVVRQPYFRIHNIKVDLKAADGSTVTMSLYEIGVAQMVISERFKVWNGLRFAIRLEDEKNLPVPNPRLRQVRGTIPTYGARSWSSPDKG